MPDIRWTAAGQLEPGREYVVMASHLPLRSITSTPRFFRAVAAIRKQLRGAEGLVGYTLRAKPLARRYWTSRCGPTAPRYKLSCARRRTSG